MFVRSLGWKIGASWIGSGRTGIELPSTGTLLKFNFLITVGDASSDTLCLEKLTSVFWLSVTLITVPVSGSVRRISSAEPTPSKFTGAIPVIICPLICC